MSTTISGTNGVTFPDSTSMQTGQQACKAWVNFNGTGTVAIRGGYNVSSITDNGTGDYTVNFTTAMPDANYAVIRSVDYDNGGGGTIYVTEVISVVTTGVRVISANNTSARYDVNRYEIAIFSN